MPPSPAQARVNVDAWKRTIEVYNDAARKGLSLSPGVYYDLMRTAVCWACFHSATASGTLE